MLYSSDITKLNCHKVYFENFSFDKSSITDGIKALSKHLEINFLSGSPFVILTAYNHIKTLIAFYSILRAGKIAVLIDPQCKAIELAEIIKDVDPCAIIYLNSSTIGFRYEEEIIFRRPDKSFIIHSDLKDVCTVVYSNAEDGFSKGAMLTEKNLLSEINSLIKTNGLSNESVTCSFLPFCHLFGFVQGILVPTYIGCNNLILDINMLRMAEIVNDIYKYKVTHLYSAPSLYYIMSKVPGVNYKLQNVKNIYSGGNKLSEFISNTFAGKTNRKIREGYGLTESSPGVILNFQEEEPNDDSIGKPMHGIEVKIIDENGAECKFDEIGEICIRGDMVFKGYFNNDKATRKAVSQGWLHTGDLGKQNKHGYIYFCGLKKNMINVSGINVYPKKLERLMKMNSNVSKVHISGEESILQGHIVVARVKLFDTNISKQEEFKKWCIVNINNSLLPKIWEFE